MKLKKSFQSLMKRNNAVIEQAITLGLVGGLIGSPLSRLAEIGIWTIKIYILSNLSLEELKTILSLAAWLNVFLLTALIYSIYLIMNKTDQIQTFPQNPDEVPLCAIFPTPLIVR